VRFAVVGAGGIGGFLAAALARSGEEVGVVARGSHLAAIQRNGLRIRAEDGEFVQHVAASDDLRELGRCDAVLVTIKAHQWKEALPQFAGIGATNTIIVPLQNGFPFWYWPDRWLHSVDPDGHILKTFNYGQVIGGVVHTSGRVIEPGVIEPQGSKLYPLGELDGRTTARITALSHAFERAGLQAPIRAEIRRDVWNKIAGNAALNPISALTRATIAPLLDNSETRAVIAQMMNETMAVQRACGSEPLMTVDERIALARRTVADVKTSMLQDLEAGRDLELEPIVGAVVELAQRYDVAVPAIEIVYTLVKCLERTLIKEEAWKSRR
jgi:2-dehydropantoate 2-reductase